MTIDKAQLKALAEAATPGPWKKTVDGVMPEGRSFGIFGNSGATDGEENRAFIAAANPATVLALLDELSGYQQGAKAEADAADEARTEVRKLKAGALEDLRLRTELMEQFNQLKAENEALRKGGFVDAFYRVAAAVGLTGARPQSPMEIFETEVLPAVQAAVKDAERYRWLRSRDLEAIRQGGVFAGMTPQNIVLNEETLDEAVDAAMSKGDQP